MALRVLEADIKIKHPNSARSNLNHLRMEAANETQHSEIPCANWVRLAGQLPDSGNLCVSSHLAEAKTGGSAPILGATNQVNRIKEEQDRGKPQQLEVSTLDA